MDRVMATSSQPSWSRAAVLRLPPEPASVPLARRHVIAVLEQHGLTDVGDAAQLVMSELVTNAVRHAGTELRVRVVANGETLRLEVADDSGEPPVSRMPGPLEPGGRGLPLVEALVDRWGMEQTASGKVVWAELRHS
jgi:anti-sigma regulatory factor (Ser/Thr protein kinase)